MDNDIEFVNVAIRIRPLVDKDTAKCLQIISENPPVLLLHERSLTFNFDYVYTEKTNQQTIYEQMVKPLVENVKKGYNCTVFANGQTGTGKTYTIGTDPHVRNEEDFGLIPRALNEFFNHEGEAEIEISLSFIEIYNEKVFDLLLSDKPDEKPLRMKGLKALGYCQEKVYNIHEANHFLKMGNKNRHTAETKQNAKSSRSHAIFTIYCSVKHKHHKTSAKLNLVDLAGSESIKKTGSEGSTRQEGVNINKGLLSIGQVMTALTTNASYIPYRQSIITSLLKDSLSPCNFISLIACVSSAAEDSTETSQTLEFAQRVKKLRNKPEVNEVISKFRKENPGMFSQPKTPFKRPAPFQTPVVSKRMRPLATINDNNLLQSCSSTQSSLSSTPNNVNSSCNESNQHHLSPVIRKYLSAMESSMMNKLELIIQSSLKRPSNVEKRRDNVENTPCIPWNAIQKEVSKLVHTEVAQLTSRKTRATSSPIEEHLKNIKKVLSYGSPFTEEINSLISERQHAGLEFKIPERPLPKKNNPKPKRTPSLSPIENVDTQRPRRSARISLRASAHKKSGDFYWSPLDKSSKFDQTRRKTSEEKPKMLTVADTPVGKRLLQNNRLDSPSTSQTKKVLTVLNTGNLRNLQLLQTIGPKTAQQILLYRNIKGKFKRISDLSELPGWGSRKFDNFVERNFLKQELL